MIDTISFYVFQIIGFILFVYFGIAVLYVFVFSLASLFRHKVEPEKVQLIRKIAVMIPAYKADNIIVETAKHAVKQDYPSDKFDVIVICDSMKKETIEQLKQIPVFPFEVDFENSNKAKSLNKCMADIGDDYEVAVVLDADNLIMPIFLNQINTGFNRGFKVVQGHRVAKNVDTSFAILDAASEEINNSIFRKGHRVLGASSSLIGSGMGVEYALYKGYMKEIDAVGEDKELEVKLLSNCIKIDYIEDALIYDEKTSEAQNFKKQRSRWIAAQTEYVNEHFFKSLVQFVSKGNFDYFDKLYQFVMPPRILMLGVLFLICTLMVLIEYIFGISTTLHTSWQGWGILFLLTNISLLLALPKTFYNWKTMKAILSIPKAFIMILGSLTQFKKARTHFIATDHNFTEKK